MGIAQISKINILGDKSLKEEVISYLQDRGVVQIRVLDKDLEEDFFPLRVDEEVREKNSKINFIFQLISDYLPKEGLFAGLKEKTTLSPDELERFVEKFPFQDLYNKASELEKKITESNAKLDNLIDQLKQCKPWINLEATLADLEETDNVEIILGTVRVRDYANLKAEVDLLPYVDIYQINSDKLNVYLGLISHKIQLSDLEKILKKYDFNRVIYPAINETPVQLIERINKEISYVQQEIAKIKDEIKKEIVSQYEGLKIIYDYYHNLEEREKVKEALAATENVFLLSGWVETQIGNDLKSYLENKYKIVAVEMLPASVEDNPPIILKNKKIVEPLEVVTDLYGRPIYGGIDATPFLFPFFILFFGLCLGDAGYGLILTLACYFFKRKFKLEGTAKKFLDIFFYSGISTIICGIFLGSFFGNFIDILGNVNFLKNLKNKLTLIDTLAQPEIFLYFSLALGFIQIITGLLIKFVYEIKWKKYLSAFLDRLPWIIFLIGIIIMLVNFNVGRWMVITAAGIIVLFGGRKSKRIFTKFFSGVYSLYGGIDYFKDILSYSRIFALGLGSGIMAMAVNTIIQLVTPIPILGIILGIIIFVAGHIFSLLINLLGTYVHTSRLQYVEFFNKFYESGGSVFVPFTQKNKYIKIKGGE